MSRFDRYLLSQFMALFGFFSLVLVAVYWVNRAVLLFDRLIGDGQSALVFLEFTALTLPNVIRLLLPISAFAATVYVTNRLTAESELVVMQATGSSAFQLARPVVIFGLIVALMMAILMHFLVPASRTTLANRSVEISENITSRFLADGTFVHPAEGITLYIRELTPNGELRDLFLSDARGTSQRITYTARRALLVRGEAGPKLIMFDGMAQSLNLEDKQLSVTRFADFTYDIGGLITRAVRTGRSVDELSTWALLNPTEAAISETGSSRAEFLYEGHSRFAQPFLATASALIGFATLLLGAYSRFGLWRQVLGAIVALVAMQLINNAAANVALQNARAWPLAYLAPLAGILLGVAMLWWAQRPRRRRRSPEALA